MTENSPLYRTHTNKENKVKCPYCEKHIKSRGLYQHVWRSSDSSHGGHKTMPEDWDTTEPEVVGQEDVSMHVPTKKEYDINRTTCKYCGENFKGQHGLSVHLSRVNDTTHPEDATVETAGIQVPDGFSDDEYLNVGIAEGQEGGEQQGVPEGYVPLADVVEAITVMEGRGNEEAADVLRKTIKPYR